MIDQARLLERAKAYDPAALSELYDQYAPKMYAYIYRRIGDAAWAEDLTSELFVRVLRAIQNEQLWRDSLPAWLYRIAHNLVIDHYRRQGKAAVQPIDEQLVAADLNNPSLQIEDASERERLGRALRQLTPDQQHVLALRFGENLKAHEVAQIMRKSTGAVEALQRRALAALERILNRESNEQKTEYIGT
ncbi:MAG: sigma-70 family RNA polymerase sigma factor [Anaerolineae bacterium]|nr:sigma-70 family RNA polymerase sigma factor [Anaerolineae bacterium]